MCVPVIRAGVDGAPVRPGGVLDLRCLRAPARSGRGRRVPGRDLVAGRQRILQPRRLGVGQARPHPRRQDGDRVRQSEADPHRRRRTTSTSPRSTTSSTTSRAVASRRPPTCSGASRRRAGSRAARSASSSPERSSATATRSRSASGSTSESVARSDGDPRAQRPRLALGGDAARESSGSSWTASSPVPARPFTRARPSARRSAAGPRRRWTSSTAIRCSSSIPTGTRPTRSSIAQNANMVAINSAVAVDFTGQVTAETIGRRQISTAGGQTPFAYGALLSRRGAQRHRPALDRGERKRFADHARVSGGNDGHPDPLASPTSSSPSTESRACAARPCASARSSWSRSATRASARSCTPRPGSCSGEPDRCATRRTRRGSSSLARPPATRGLSSRWRGVRERCRRSTRTR